MEFYALFVALCYLFSSVDVDGKTTVTKEKCYGGPDAWCQSFQHAVDCHALKHCIQTVWEVQETKDEPQCVTCSLSLPYVRSALELGKRDKAEELLSYSCQSSVVPAGAITPCLNTVSDIVTYNYTELVDLVVSSTRPSLVCRLLNLCHDEISVTPALPEESNIAKSSCGEPSVACRTLWSAAKCNMVPECKKLDWVNRESPVNEAWSCAACISLLEQLQKIILTNDTEDAIKAALDTICVEGQSMGLDYNTCIQVMDKYVLDLIFDLAPASVCTLLDICPLLKQNVVIKANNIELIVPDFNTQYLPKDGSESRHELIGNSHCTWGPAYWCTNLTTAAECQTVTNCIENSWKYMELETDNDDVCKICKDMVQQARDTLQSNETQEELREVFEGSCKLIPLKAIRTECIKVVDDFIPELTEMLVSQMNPTAVCTVAGLCNNAKIDRMLLNLKDEQEEYPDEEVCKRCNMFGVIIENKFRSSSKQNVLAKLLQICGELSSYSDICTMTVFNNFEAIYSRLDADLKPYKVCHLSGMCSYKYHFHPEENSKRDSTELITGEQVNEELRKNKDLPCDLCKDLVNHFRQILIENTTKDEFHDVLAGICQQMGKLKDKCVTFVNSNFEVIYDFLVSELNSTAVCLDVGLCTFTNQRVTDGKERLLAGRLIPTPYGNMLFPAEYKSNSAELEAMDQSNAVNDKTLCTICQYVAHFLQEELSDPTEQKDIEGTLKRVCSVVPEGMKQECRKFIDQYSPLIMALIAEEVDPSLLCPHLKLCPVSSEEENESKIPCTFCLLAMQSVLDDLQSNKTEEKIKDALDKICNQVMTDMVSKCKTFVERNYESLVDMIATDFTPEEVCVFLDICSPHRASILVGTPKQTSTTAPIMDDIEDTNMILTDGEMYQQNDAAVEINPSTDSQRGHQSSKTCLLCETVIESLEDQLTPNMTKAEVEKLLLDFCKQLKGEMQVHCIHFTVKYVDKIADILENEIKPREICAVLKLCPFLKQSEEAKSRCQFCEAVIGSLNGILADPYLDYEALEYVDKVCDMVSDDKRSMCMEIMNEVTPMLESIALQIPPWFICTKMKFCPYDSHGPLFLEVTGGSGCTWGHTYWCQSKTTAAMCQATEHCQTYVWKGKNPPE